MGQIGCCCAGESRRDVDGSPATPRRPEQPEIFPSERNHDLLDSPTAPASVSADASVIRAVPENSPRDSLDNSDDGADAEAQAKFKVGEACVSAPLGAYLRLPKAQDDRSPRKAHMTFTEDGGAPRKESAETDDGEATPVAKPGKVARNKSRAMTFSEKIAEDFEEPALVVPDAIFDVTEAAFQIFGELRFPEKFTEDKNVGVKTSAACTSDGLEDSYAWSSPTNVDGATSIAVLCQKGQKSPSDPTPNQDNYFMKFVGGVSIYGVMDGHGPFGHLVSFRLVQTLPHILINHPSFGTDWEKAIKESFLAAQQELLTFGDDQDVNVEASGSAGSIMIVDGQQIHIAHIGDARIMLASYNKKDSKVIYATEDHKPELPAERKRLENHGTEVREVDKDSFRIYRKGTTFPGLTMSRAFGDTACAGVIQEPEYRQFSMQPKDEYYAIVASDGIWEFIEAEECVTLTAKKLRLKGPKETLQALVTQSRKRWEAVCGEYCDDITGILVQWNAKSDEVDTNHSLTLQRHESLETKVS